MSMKHCRYCKSEMDTSDAAYAENPFCAKCLPERMEKAAEERGPGEVVIEGDYAVWRPKEELEHDPEG